MIELFSYSNVNKKLMKKNPAENWFLTSLKIIIIIYIYNYICLNFNLCQTIKYKKGCLHIFLTAKKKEKKSIKNNIL